MQATLQVSRYAEIHSPLLCCDWLCPMFEYLNWALCVSPHAGGPDVIQPSDKLVELHFVKPTAHPGVVQVRYE